MHTTQAASVSIRCILTEKPLWILVAIGSVFFWKPLLLGETFFFRDIAEHFLPQKALLVDSVKAGEFPLWDPFRQGGRPFLGNPNNVVLYPSNVLYFIFPLLTAFNLDIVLHFLLMGAAAYTGARVVGLQPVAAFLCGAIYGYCGYALSLGVFLSRLYAAPYLPLMVATWHLFLLKGERRSFFLCCLFGVVQLFSGAPEMLMMSTFFLGLWTFCIPKNISALRAFGWLFLFIFFVIGIGSIQVLPAAEIVSGSYRGSGMGLEDFGTYSLHPKRIPEVFLAQFFGRSDTLDRTDYWGRHLDALPFPHPYFISIYFGAVTLCLAAAGVRNRDPGAAFSSRARKILFVLAVISLILALGKFLPAFGWFYALPVIRWFRYPVKFVGLAVFPIALLAGAGLTSLLNRTQTANRSWFTFIAWSIAILLVLMTLFLKSSALFGSSIALFFFGSDHPKIVHGLFESCLHAALFFSAFLLCLHMSRLRQPVFFGWVIASVVFFDLLIAGAHVNPTAPRDLFFDVPKLVPVVKSIAGSGKLYRQEAASQFALRAPTNDILWEHRFNLEVLNFYFGGLYQIPVVFHRDKDQMSSRPLLQLKDLLERLPWNLRAGILRSAGASVMIATERIDSSQFELLSEIPNASSIRLFLYRIRGALTDGSFVPRVLRLDGEKSVFHAMMHPDFDPSQFVLIHEERTSSGETGCASNEVKLLKRTFNRSEYQVKNSCSGMLVFTDIYDPGWRILVDGSRAKLMKANFAFSGVFLQAGQHQISKQYRPRSVLLGGALSILSFLIFLIVLSKWKRGQVTQKISE